MLVERRLDKYILEYALMRNSRMIKLEIESYLLIQVNIPNIKFILKNGIIFITEFIKTTFQALNAVPNRIGKLF